MRLCASLNDAHGIGMPPTSVGGGLLNDGKTSRSCGFCGPGAEIAAGLEVILPCAGRSGVPNTAALAAADAPSATAPEAAPARTPRRFISVMLSSPNYPFSSIPGDRDEVP